jgi:hypothetical protein
MGVTTLRLPGFLIIGAMKSGTSSLHRYLGQHPDVFVSKRKELDFFSYRYEQGFGWYMRQFRAGVAGESSPNYLKLHLWPETAERIHRHLPHARLICVLRNPIDRSLSHYLHGVWRGRTKRPFARAAAGDSNIVMTSRYGWQLGHYLKYFDPDQLLLVTTEQLRADPTGTTGRVLRFIGVDDRAPVDTSQRHNVTSANLAGAGKPVPADPSLVVEGGRVALSPRERARLAELFQPEVDQLRSTWPRFPGWQL